MEFETIQTLTDVGYPMLLLVFLAWGAKRLWQDVWSWWIDVFWPGREGRWIEQTKADVMRDAEYRRLAESFIGAMQEYQNGFQTRNQVEHERIIREMEKVGDTVCGQTEILVAEVRQWQTEVVAVLQDLHTHNGSDPK